MYTTVPTTIGVAVARGVAVGIGVTVGVAVGKGVGVGNAGKVKSKSFFNVGSGYLAKVSVWSATVAPSESFGPFLNSKVIVLPKKVWSGAPTARPDIRPSFISNATEV